MGLDSCNRTELTTIELSLKFQEHTASVALELKQIYSSPTVAYIFKEIKIVYQYLEFGSFESIRYTFSYRWFRQYSILSQAAHETAPDLDPNSTFLQATLSSGTRTIRRSKLWNVSSFSVDGRRANVCCITSVTTYHGIPFGGKVPGGKKP